jgi:hypothetical protein
MAGSRKLADDSRRPARGEKAPHSAKRRTGNGHQPESLDLATMTIAHRTPAARGRARVKIPGGGTLDSGGFQCAPRGQGRGSERGVCEPPPGY